MRWVGIVAFCLAACSSAPARLAAPAVTVDVNGRSVSVSWSRVAGALQYVVEWDGEERWSTTPQADFTFDPGTTHCFVVSGATRTERGFASERACASIHALPTAPANLTATPTVTGVTLTWDGEATSYVVSAGPAGAAPNDRPVTTTSADIDGPREGDTWNFAVTARNDVGASSPARLSYTVPSAAPGWKRASSGVPEGTTFLAARGGFLYAVGPRAIGSARIDPDGTPGPFNVQPGLVMPGFGASSAVAMDERGNLFVSGGGETMLGTSNEVFWTQCTNGQCATFRKTRSLRHARRYHTSFAADGHLYVLGGDWWSGGSYTGFGFSLPTVEVAAIGGDGLSSEFRETANLPHGGTWSVTVLEGRVFALSGTLVESEFVDAEGDLDTWHPAVAQPPLLAPLNAFGPMVAAAGHLVVAPPFDAYPATRGPKSALLIADGEAVSWTAAHEDDWAHPRGAPVLAADGDRVYVGGGWDGAPVDDLQWGRLDASTGHFAPVPASSTLSAPDEPLDVIAEPGPGSATVRWSAPRHDGGSAITAYVVRVLRTYPDEPVQEVRTTQLQATFALKDGDYVAFEVQALNALGAGPAGRSSAVVAWSSRVWRPGVRLGCGLGGAAVQPVGTALFQDCDTKDNETTDALVFFSGPGEPIAAVGMGRWADIGPSVIHLGPGVTIPIDASSSCLARVGGTDFFFNKVTRGDVRVDCRTDDGYVGAYTWPSESSTPPIEPTRDHEGLAVANGFVVAIGGVHEENGITSPLDDVLVAPLNGHLPGAWAQAARLPQPWASPVVTARGGRVYLVSPPWAPGTVQALDVLANGAVTLSAAGLDLPWVPDDTVTPVIAQGTLALLGGHGPSVLLGGLDANGNVDSWRTDPAWDFVAVGSGPPLAVWRQERLLVWWNGTRVQLAGLIPDTLSLFPLEPWTPPN